MRAGRVSEDKTNPTLQRGGDGDENRKSTHANEAKPRQLERANGDENVK